jgi:pimeloyl-ACP methyl ester carboxylesterase
MHKSGWAVAGASCLAITSLCLGSTPAVAQTPAEVFGAARKLTTADAIDEQKFVQIGGIPQWISVRSRHRGNPILLVLHGGPAFTLSPVSYYYMRDWEEYFTVVQWDQRGAGKTYAATDPAKVRATLTIPRMVSDTEELIGYLTHTYGKKRVLLLGHSFGTLLGVKVALDRPDLLYAYVGIGQFVDFQRSERLGYEETLADAVAAGNAQAVKDLHEVAPFPDPIHPERDLQNLGKERQWLAAYGGYYKVGGVGHTSAIASMSPDYTPAELKMRDQAQGFSDEILWGEIGHVDFTHDTRFRVPIVLLQGRADRGTNSRVVADWFAHIRAPSKQLVWFEDSAHMVQEEEPGKLLVTLVDRVLPLATERPTR